MTFLGIDLGTSGLRLLLIDEDGKSIASSEAAYPTKQPNFGWSEQDPADWIKALEDCIAELSAKEPAFQNMRGIGVSGHMHGAVLLNDEGEIIRPCMMWNDARSHFEAEKLDAMPEFRSISGNIVFPGFTAPKLEWLRNNEPENYQKFAKVLLPAAFLNFYLSGEYIGDISDASGTSWLNVKDRVWSSELLESGRVNIEQMVELVEGCEPAGQLRSELKASWRLKNDVIIAGGAADNAAAACGMGAIKDGNGFVSLGTSGVILVARDAILPRPELAVHSFCHAVPGTWYQMGVMLSATDSLNWLARLTDRSPAALTEELGKKIAKPSRLLFQPYLSGERTPHNDALIRGSFVGLSASTDRKDMTQAVLEGVAFGLRDCMEALRKAKSSIETLHVIGGGATSDYWTLLLATVLGEPLNRPTGGEFGAALGAARLGLVASTERDWQEVMTPPESNQCFEPIEQLSEQFDAAYNRFKDAYPSMRTLA